MDKRLFKEIKRTDEKKIEDMLIAKEKDIMTI